jgi:hypothetical protein
MNRLTSRFELLLNCLGARPTRKITTSIELIELIELIESRHSFASSANNECAAAKTSVK